MDDLEGLAHGAPLKLLEVVMRGILLLAVAVASLYAAPALIENASGQCEAVARRLNSMDPTAGTIPAWEEPLIVGAGTLMVAHLATQRFRAVPSSLTCAGGYWALRIDPDVARELFADDAPAKTAEELMHATPQGRATGKYSTRD
jgi:hypothetical protein